MPSLQSPEQKQGMGRADPCQAKQGHEGNNSKSNATHEGNNSRSNTTQQAFQDASNLFKNSSFFSLLLFSPFFFLFFFIQNFVTHMLLTIIHILNHYPKMQTATN